MNLERRFPTARWIVPALLFPLLLGAAACGGIPRAASAVPQQPAAFYAGIGAELVHYGVDVEAGTLEPRGVVALPGEAQYAWPHPTSEFLYVAWAVGGGASARYGVSAFRVDPSGGLAPHGEPIPLPWRPVHLSVDPAGRHVLAAYYSPSRATVHRIEADGTLGAEVEPPAPLDTGVFAHQIRVAPSGRAAVLVARGNEPTPTRPEDPGAVKIFDYADGVLTDRASLAPDGGFGYQPRHVDFHPTRPWMYLAVERQHRVEMYRWDETFDRIEPLPAFRSNTLDEPDNLRPTQMLGAIHVHPNGRSVYASNRTYGTVQVDGVRVLTGGENSIAVLSIDQRTGEPTLIQTIDSRGIHPRTFSIEPSGRLLVAANTTAIDVANGEGRTTVPASLAVFRIAGDGRLHYLRKYDIEPGRGTPFWAGFVTLPRAQ